MVNVEIKVHFYVLGFISRTFAKSYGLKVLHLRPGCGREDYTTTHKVRVSLRHLGVPIAEGESRCENLVGRIYL